MKLGAEPKKLAALGALLLLAAVVMYMNMSGSSETASSPSPRPAVAVAPGVNVPLQRGITTPASDRRREVNARAAVGEFKPRVGVRDPKDRPDPATIDPTLRLDLLAKVQSIDVGPPGRNIFQTGTAPEAAPVALPKVAKIVMNVPPPRPEVVQPSGPPPPPPPPPITFKYYGYTVSKANGRKSAFLLDGEDILIAGENETVKRRYRVVRIGVNSITIEDTQFKNTQTLPLQENLAG